MTAHIPPSVAARARVEGWDLLRGVALVMVMLVHALDAAGIRGHEGMGMVALTSFFVLSGYLITGILLRDVNRSGGIRFREFYLNRMVRLLPPLIPVFIAYVVLEASFDRTRDPIWMTLAIGFGYVGNLPYLRELTGTLQHLWSLAFEEQFYFAWPALLALTLRRRITTHVTLLLIASSTLLLLLSLWLLWDAPQRVYTLPTTWASAVLLGCLAALHRDRARALLGPRGRWGRPVLAVALLVVLMCCLTWRLDGVVVYLGGPLICGAACLVLVLWLQEVGTVTVRWLRPLVWLGTISYAGYLWNYPVSMYLHEVVRNEAAQVGLSLAVTVLMAWLSWVLLEGPAAAWRATRGGGEAAGASASTSQPKFHA